MFDNASRSKLLKTACKQWSENFKSKYIPDNFPPPETKCNLEPPSHDMNNSPRFVDIIQCLTEQSSATEILEISTPLIKEMAGTLGIAYARESITLARAVLTEIIPILEYLHAEKIDPEKLRLFKKEFMPWNYTFFREINDSLATYHEELENIRKIPANITTLSSMLTTQNSPPANFMQGFIKIYDKYESCPESASPEEYFSGCITQLCNAYLACGNQFFDFLLTLPSFTEIQEFLQHWPMIAKKNFPALRTLFANNAFATNPEGSLALLKYLPEYEKSRIINDASPTLIHQFAEICAAPAQWQISSYEDNEIWFGLKSRTIRYSSHYSIIAFELTLDSNNPCLTLEISGPVTRSQIEKLCHSLKKPGISCHSISIRPELTNVVNGFTLWMNMVTENDPEIFTSIIHIIGKHFPIPHKLLDREITQTATAWIKTKQKLIYQLHNGLMAEDQHTINMLQKESDCSTNDGDNFIKNWLDKLNKENLQAEYIVWALFLLTSNFYSMETSARALQMLEELRIAKPLDEIYSRLLKTVNFYALAKDVESGPHYNEAEEKRTLRYLSEIAGIDFPDDEKDPMLFLATTLGKAQQKIGILTAQLAQASVTATNQRESAPRKTQHRFAEHLKLFGSSHTHLKTDKTNSCQHRSASIERKNW